MLEPRAPNSSELTQVIGFLDRELRANCEWSISKEYPTTFIDSNLHNIRIISDDEKILSHAVIKPLIIKTPLAIYKVAAIGSVVTDRNHRNQGLSQKIMKNCLEKAIEQKCDLALLWTDIFDFYRKQGFELAGNETSIQIEQDLKLPVTENLKILDTNKISPEAILRLYQRHSVTTHRTVADIQRYMNIPMSKIYTAWNGQNELLAYAIEGKGVDLNGYIHEWGGKTSSLLYLFNEIHKRQNRTITIIIPGHSLGILRKANELGLPIHEGHLGMIKVLDWENLITKIHRAAKYIGINDLILKKLEDHWLVGIATDSFAIRNETEMVRLIFGPTKKFQDNLSSLNKIFPLPIWAWGWDSV